MHLSKQEREKIRTMFGGFCAYCGCELGCRWCADHVEPIYRKTRYTTHPVTGYGMFVATDECYFPDRDTKENLFPCCGPCNIHKGPLSLSTWRKNLEDITGVLQRNYPTYRHAVRFGQVVEQRGPIVFWFEKCVPRQ